MNRTRAGRLIASIALAGVLAVSGCSTASTPPDEVTSAPLEQTVLSITTAVAADDWTTADAGLDTLSSQVDAALADGTLTVARAAEIRAAIELVRDDIAAERTPGDETPTPTPPQKPGSDKPGNGNDKKND